MAETVKWTGIQLAMLRLRRPPRGGGLLRAPEDLTITPTLVFRGKRLSTMPIIVYLTVGMLINYVDRGNLSTAAPLMQEGLHLSASQLGALLSAFYYGYVFFMPLAGWLAERYGAYRVLAGGAALWTIATMSTGFVDGFVPLLLLRVLLGVGESVAFPAMSKILASELETNELGTANGILAFGYLIGPALGTLAGSYVMNLYGWRSLFWSTGTISFMWLVGWSWMTASSASAEKTPASSQVPFNQILRQRAVWGAALGSFAADYSYYFILSWLPYYLVRARGFSISAMATTASWAYLMNALAALSWGWLSDRWIKAGLNATAVHKGVMGIAHIGGIACMVGMVSLPLKGAIACLVIYEFIAGLSFPSMFAIPQLMAGPTAAARWVGVQNAVGNMAGFVAPAVTGVLVDRTGLFDIAFIVAAVTNVLGLAGWIFVLPSIKPVRWRT